MRIKLLKNLELSGHDFKANDVVNIHIKAAKQLIEAGQAESFTIDDFIDETENEIEENAHQIQESTQIGQQAD